MTYNILGGSEDRIDLIVDTILDESPDFLVVNEANSFLPDVSGHLRKLADTTGLSYAAAAPSGQDTFHVLLFSEKPLDYVQFLTPLVRAGVIAVVDSIFGQLAIVGTHLTPFAEHERLTEITSILEAVKPYPNAIIMGDLNALSPDDDYRHLTYAEMNTVQREKFTADEQVRFDTIRKVEEAGFVDTAVAQERNHLPTSPTALTHDVAHANTRLDYVFVSQPLANYVVDYRVIKNRNTVIASDHYPVVVELKREKVASADTRRRAIDKEWFDFDWDFTKIWEMHLPEETMPIREIAWHMDLPLWEENGEPYSVTPREVLHDPARNREEYQSIMDADLSFPVEIMWWNGRWMLLDGVHRLAKAIHEGHDTLRIHKVPHERIPDIQVDRDS